MKLHYTKILLFSLPLNVLLTASSNACSNNEPCITPHTRNTTARMLIECDIYTSFYDNDPEMKFVKENFNRQTSQRFEEYNERMIDKRQKCKEQCNKDIQKIIVKDKVQKSLAEKVEKGCLKCGCGLGGVATSVGLLGTAVVNELKRASMAAAIDSAIVKGTAEGAAKGAEAGVFKLIELIKSKLGIERIAEQALGSVFTAKDYTNVTNISGSLYVEYSSTCLSPLSRTFPDNPICANFAKLGLNEGTSQGYHLTTPDSLKLAVGNMVSEAEGAAAAESTKVATAQIFSLKKTNISAVQTEFNSYISYINASIITILIIVLVMVIIYLILRYRRKKKMKKKIQYIKLLKE
ncbi:PIR protein, putative [Plasmodium sp.]|nr:PIR protein, putative [Plasmodium sp.]